MWSACVCECECCRLHGALRWFDEKVDVDSRWRIIIKCWTREIVYSKGSFWIGRWNSNIATHTHLTTPHNNSYLWLQVILLSLSRARNCLLLSKHIFDWCFSSALAFQCDRFNFLLIQCDCVVLEAISLNEHNMQTRWIIAIDRKSFRPTYDAAWSTDSN